MRERKAGKMLCMFVSSLGLLLVLCETWRIFHVRHFHVASWRTFLYMLLWHLLNGAIFAVLAIRARRSRHPGCLAGISVVACSIFCFFFMVFVVFGIPTGVSSYTTNPKNWGKYDAAASELLSNGFLPDTLPADAVCTDYAYYYENFGGASLEIHATCLYAQKDFEKEVRRLETYAPEPRLRLKIEWSANPETLEISYSVKDVAI